MRVLVRALDRWLRRALGVYEFCDDADCLLRVRLTTAVRAVALPDTYIRAGAPILELHLWNEHIPPLPPQGPDLAWARQVQRRTMASFRALAEAMQREPRLGSVEALMGNTVLLTPGDDGGEALFRRLGFVARPYRNRLGRLGEFWENLYAWWIMWAFNPGSLRHRRLLGLRRCEVWMSAAEFRRRYGAPQRQ